MLYRLTMRHSFLFFVLSASLAAACGVGTSQTSHPGGPSPEPGPDASPEPDPDAGEDANSCLSGVELNCVDCSGNPVPAECVNGSLECPRYGCPIELPDAGCNGFPIACPAFCSSACIKDAWTCSCEVFDAAPEPDAFVPDGGPEPLFACGDQGCYAATTYCQVTTGGPVVADAATGFSCIPLPSTCSAGAASCACIQAVQGIGCGCVESGGEVTVTCEIQ